MERILCGLRIESLPDKERFAKADIYSRFASLFLLNSDEPVAFAERVFTDLKTDKFTRTHTISVLSAYDSIAFDDRRSTLTALIQYGKDVTDGVLALGVLTGRFTDRERDILTDALTSGIPYKISGLAIRGGDLLAIGIKGEQVGEALSSLLYAVINGEVENEKDALVNYLRK